MTDPKSAPATGTLKLGPRRALFTAGIVAFVLGVIGLLGGERALETTVAEPLHFKIRAAFGLAPQLSPQIRIFAVDDRTVTQLGQTEPSLAVWSEVIRQLAKARPKRIMLDLAFAHPYAADAAKEFVESVKAAGIPVVAKAIAQEGRLAGTRELAVEKRAVSLSRLLANDPRHQRMPPGWLPDNARYVYGPDAQIAPVFSQIGHDFGYAEGGIEPLLNAGSTLFLPHWTLFAGGEPEIHDGSLHLGGFEVPVDSYGQLPVNFISSETIRSRIASLSELLGSAKNSVLVPGVQEGDTVIILPNLHVGSIDFAETQAGRIPLSFVHVALINSAVTGDWLGRLPAGTALIALLSLLGAGLALAHQRRSFPYVLTGVGFLSCGVSVACFLAFHTIVPWVLPVAGLLITGFVCNHELVRLAEQKAALLRHDLQGILSPETLQRLGSKGLAHLEATEQIVTIMFIDIVGFSRAAEKQTPKEAFSSLKSLVDQLRKAVHDHGGVVDRTMGDGMLCVFGYDFLGQGHSADVHARAAAACAAKIQRDNLKRMLKAQKTNQAVFPLRIGINTTGVYLGNLGDTERTDLTVIGKGVNFAQRLEAACDRHMVMLGASTRDLVAGLAGIDFELRRRHIRIKHHDSLVEAYELDAFHVEPQLLIEGDEAYRQFIGIERNDVRNPVPYPGLIRVTTNYGDGEMINFSGDGFTIKLPEYYAKDVTISFRMDTEDGWLGERLETSGLATLVLEVRWARPHGDGFIHGCLIKNLNADQRKAAISHLREAIQRFIARERRSA